jgi:hypothetical protein
MRSEAARRSNPIYSDRPRPWFLMPTSSRKLTTSVNAICIIPSRLLTRADSPADALRVSPFRGSNSASASDVFAQHLRCSCKRAAPRRWTAARSLTPERSRTGSGSQRRLRPDLDTKRDSLCGLLPAHWLFGVARRLGEIEPSSLLFEMSRKLSHRRSPCAGSRLGSEPAARGSLISQA